MLDATITEQGALNMPRILAFHEVKDVQHWLSSPKRAEFFGPLGGTEIKTYVDPEGSKRVGVTMNITDMDGVAAALQTQEGADVMEHDGVIPETLVILVES